jgi:hypothetical protein
MHQIFSFPNVVFKLSVALIYNLLHIYFRLKCNLLSSHPFFLTTCFGRIRPSSDVVYLAKIVALCVKISYRVWTRCLLIKINSPELKLINIPMFSLWSSSSLLTPPQPPPHWQDQYYYCHCRSARNYKLYSRIKSDEHTHLGRCEQLNQT